MVKDFEFELVCKKNGAICLRRYDAETNKYISCLLEDMSVKEIEEINIFLKKSVSKRIFVGVKEFGGQEWCG